MPDIFTKELSPSYKRVDAHMFDPRDLRLDPELSGRVDPPSESDIKKRIDDFLNPAVGQLQSILIAKNDEGYPIIVDGHIRWMAAMEITKKKQGPHDDASGKRGVFKLKCTYFVGSPLERYIATIKANIRKDPTSADDAYNVSRLVHNFSMSEEDVALKVYGRTGIDGKPDVTWIKERLAYAELAPEAQAALKSGSVKVSQIAQLAKLAKTAQRQAVKGLEPGQKLTTAAIKLAASNGKVIPAGDKPKRLTMKDELEFWGPITGEKKQVGKLAEVIVRRLKGELVDNDAYYKELTAAIK